MWIEGAALGSVAAAGSGAEAVAGSKAGSLAAAAPAEGAEEAGCTAVVEKPGLADGGSAVPGT